MNTDPGFLGRGWAFPPSFERSRGSAKMVTAEADIDQSLAILFQTRPGERVMQPAYGCRLQEFVFEPMNASTKAAIEAAIRRAILFFEARISVERISVETADWLDGKMQIQLTYRIKTTNTRHNVVFPFYVDEGTLIAEPPRPTLQG